jgi:hypothetical protein
VLSGSSGTTKILVSVSFGRYEPSLDFFFYVRAVHVWPDIAVPCGSQFFLPLNKDGNILF